MTSDYLVDSSFTLLLGAMLASFLPLAAAVWAMFTLARLQRGQTELLARLAAIERRLAGRA